jgi:hypothetical protein
MKIKQITSQHRNDFCAVMQCEHCGVEEKLTTGYNDAYYHERVIPAMHCQSCGLNRSGENKTTEAA